jgi:hypothetical protein
MTEAILSGAKLPPISVRILPNGKVELKDGATRYLSTKAACKDKIFATTYHDEALQPDGDEWFDIQCRLNDHMISTPNSEADIESQISRRVNAGVFEKKVGFKYLINPDKFIDEGVDYLKSIYKNCGIGTRKLKNMLKRCLLGTITTLFESYSKESAMEFVKNFNPHSWTTTKPKRCNAIGDIDNNVCFYPVASIPQLKTNAFANAAYKKIDNPSTNIYVVFYIGELAGKTDTKIIQLRQDVETEYDKINGAYKVFSGLYFLPQIKSGPKKENLSQLIKAR